MKTDYQFSVEINGLTVQARYSRKDVDELFFPLLRRWAELQQEKQRRVLIMLAAPPGVGKTTLSRFLSRLSRETPGLPPVTAIGIDGFHRRQEYLLSHTVMRDGQKIPMVRIKGAPETFDLEKLRERVALVASGTDCFWPDYDRLLHNPVEDSQRVTGKLILLEGNYLLLDAEDWRDLQRYADSTLRITADPALLRDRLIERKAASGTPLAEAKAFVDFSDMANVRLCLSRSLPADLTLALREDGSYQVQPGEPN